MLAGASRDLGAYHPAPMARTPDGPTLDTADTRPLSARSVLASTLLGVDPPWLPSRVLVRSGELFGISEGTTRTAISRMVAKDELTAEEDGYGLAGHLRDRHARQQAGRLAPVLPRWDGAWELAVVVGERRSAADRTALRRAMHARKLAEWREGVWLRPANLPPDRAAAASALVRSQCRLGRFEPADDPRRLAADLWDLDGWAGRARALRRSLAPLCRPLERGRRDVLPDAFLVSATVLRHLAADPLLPDELVPPRWPATALRDDYARFDAAFKAVWRDWFRAQG